MTLVLVAHGTREPAGAIAVHRLAGAVRARLGGLPVRVAYADVREPSVEAVLRAVTGPAVVVPAFLASGYHVRTDVPAQVAAVGRDDVRITAALGPHPGVVAAVHERLLRAGWRPGDPVVLAAAGSSDPIALSDVRQAAVLLGARLGTAVRIGYVTTAAPRVPDAVAGQRAPLGDAARSGASTAGRAVRPRVGRVAIAPWLLAPGLFQRSLSDAGADLVAEPIGVHPRVVELIARRYLGALCDRAHPGLGAAPGVGTAPDLDIPPGPAPGLDRVRCSAGVRGVLAG